MPNIGKMNELRILRQSDCGLMLDGEDLGAILMPNRYMPEQWEVDDVLEVFLMLDSEDRLTAVRDRPYAMVGEIAHLKVVSVTQVGAFLDWGLPKDLFVPYREQKIPLREGQSYVVFIYFDQESRRIAASTKLDHYLDQTASCYTEGEQVELMICAKTDLGYKAAVNGRHWGVIFYNEVFQKLDRGQKVVGYIKQLREDGKIDLTLKDPAVNDLPELPERVLQYIKDQGGFIPITAKTPPEEIYELFGVSKKNFKRAVSALYKDRLITLDEDGTRLVVEA